MKCPECKKRMKSNGSHERKDGQIVQNLVCKCGAKAVALVKILAVQHTERQKAGSAEASLKG